MGVFVADYHVGSHTHALRFLLSVVASGKSPVPEDGKMLTLWN